MKSLIDLLQSKELPFVGEIIDAEIPEVAGVDLPATGIQWSRFKSISPTLAPGANYTADLATGVQPTPTFTESTGGEPDDPFNRREVMKADIAGHDGKVTTSKAVLRALDSAIAAGVLGKNFGEHAEAPAPSPCEAAAIADGLSPDQARAACAGQEEKSMTRKDVAAPAPTEEEVIAAEAELQQPDVAEIPATPSEWSLGACISHANETMGLSEADATAACTLVRETYRDPGSEQGILVPEGNDPTGLINAAAYQLGTHKSIKSEHRRTVTPDMKLSGRDEWGAKFKRWLGIKPAADAVGVKAVQFMQGIEAQVGEIMTEATKSREDMRALMQLVADQTRIIAQATGTALPMTEAPAPAAPAPAPAANPLQMVEMKAAPSAPAGQAKEGAAAGAPMVDAPAGPAITPEQLAQALQDPQIRELLMEALGVEDPDAGLPDLVGAGAAPTAPAMRMAGPAVGAPAKRVSVASVPQERTMQVKAAERQDGGIRRSSILGTNLRRDEIAAARAELQGGGLRQLSWKR